MRRQIEAGGSSPLTRGKRPTGRHRRRQGRLIPAHAGKTPRNPLTPVALRAHPRSRGENRSGKTIISLFAGSSPLTRGKPPLTVLQFTGVGLIPAHAGKTTLGAGACARSQAHPRSRGENRFHDRRRRHAHGSSPLTRGKHLVPRHAQSLERLIPAHAGKTWSPRGVWSLAAAHPRSRGENSKACPH